MQSDAHALAKSHLEGLHGRRAGKQFTEQLGRPRLALASCSFPSSAWHLGSCCSPSSCRRPSAAPLTSLPPQRGQRREDPQPQEAAEHQAGKLTLPQPRDLPQCGPAAVAARAGRDHALCAAVGGDCTSFPALSPAVPPFSACASWVRDMAAPPAQHQDAPPLLARPRPADAQRVHAAGGGPGAQRRCAR